MAYAQPTVQQRQLQDLSEGNSANVTLNSGSGADTGISQGNSSTGTPGNSAALTQQSTGGNQFVNFQDLIEANKPSTENYSKTIGAQIGVPNAQNVIGGINSSAPGSVDSGLLHYDQNVVDQVLANPNNAGLYDTSGYKTLTSILGGKGYTGPTSATDVYKSASDAVKGVQDKSALLDNTAGLKTLFLQNPNKGTTPGGAMLDAALVSATPGSQEQIAQVRSGVGGLNDTLQSGITGLAGKISDATANAAGQKTALQGQATTAIDKFKTDNNAELAALNSSESSKVAAVQEALKTGNTSLLASLLPNYNSEAALKDIISKVSTGGPVEGRSYIPENMPKAVGPDLSTYSTIAAPTRTTGNVVDANEAARYSGINNTFGLTDDGYIKSANNGGFGDFDSAGALRDLNNLYASRQPADTGNVQLPPGANYNDQITDPRTGQQTTLGDYINSVGGGDGPGSSPGTGGEAGSVGAGPGSVSGGVTSGQVGMAIGAVASAMGAPPGVGTVANATGLSQAVADGINAAIGQANQNSVAAVSPEGMTPAGLAAAVDSAPNVGEAQGTSAAVSASQSANGVTGVTGASVSAAATAAANNASATPGMSDAAIGAAAQAAADATMDGATPAAAAEAGVNAAAAVSADNDSNPDANGTVGDSNANGVADSAEGDADSADGTAGDSGGGSGGGGGCVIATALVQTHNWKPLQKDALITWCEDTLHGTKLGECLRRGYQVVASKIVVPQIRKQGLSARYLQWSFENATKLLQKKEVPLISIPNSIVWMGAMMVTGSIVSTRYARKSWVALYKKDRK